MTDQLEFTVDLALTRPATEGFEVTRASIQRFAIATGITSPVHHDVRAAGDAGYPDVAAPPYFFVSLGLAMGQVRPRAQLGEGGMPADDPLAASKVVAGE